VGEAARGDVEKEGRIQAEQVKPGQVQLAAQDPAE
jgi:hypothetical protein